MTQIPVASAVLLLHNPSGAFPMLGSSGGISGQAAHSLSYDSRTGQYEDKGGCDREPTERDMALLEARRIGGQVAAQLDYDAREGAWAGKGAGMMEDCSYWGQDGPLTRDEIERDMAACGGCCLKSVVSVDRRYAAALGLDSKAAFEELLRRDWQEMMVAAGAADRESDVHWYACYHTDAQNSLHVHIGTWAADGRLEAGWNPSARATREQKAILYRDAYAPVRMQRNLEQDYYRMLLPRLAAAEMGDHVPERDIERLREKAVRAGVDEIPVERTMGESGRSKVAMEAERVTARLDEGEGLKARDWKLHSEAGKVVRALRENSAPVEAALLRYRQLAEVKADLAGLGVAEPPAGLSGPRGKAALERESAAREVARHERERFVRKDMDEIMRRIRNQVIRSADPNARERSLARDEAGRISHRLVTQSLRPGGIGLDQLSSDRLRALYQDAARRPLPGVPETAEAPKMAASDAAEAARIVCSSPVGAKAIAEIAGHIKECSAGKSAGDDAMKLARNALEDALAKAVKWRFDAGLVDPIRMEHDSIPRSAERAIARDMVSRAVATQGVSLGLSRQQGEELQGHISAAERLAAGERDGIGDEALWHVRQAAEAIGRSPAMAPALDSAIVREVAANPQARIPDRRFVEASAIAAVERRIITRVTGGEVRQDAQEPQDAPMGISGFAAMVAAAVVSERSMEQASARASRKRPSAYAAQNPAAQLEERPRQ